MTFRRVLSLGLLLSLWSVPLRAQLPTLPNGVSHETDSPDGARYQILQAQTAAKWTFRLDRFTGQVAILGQTRDGNYVWQNCTMTGLPDIRLGNRPRFQLFLSGLSAKFSFLLDTDTGKTWTLLTLTDEAGKEAGYGWKPFSE